MRAWTNSLSWRRARGISHCSTPCKSFANCFIAVICEDKGKGLINYVESTASLSMSFINWYGREKNQLTNSFAFLMGLETEPWHFLFAIVNSKNEPASLASWEGFGHLFAVSSWSTAKHTADILQLCDSKQQRDNVSKVTMLGTNSLYFWNFTLRGATWLRQENATKNNYNMGTGVPWHFKLAHDFLQYMRSSKRSRIVREYHVLHVLVAFLFLLEPFHKCRARARH